MQVILGRLSQDVRYQECVVQRSAIRKLMLSLLVWICCSSAHAAWPNDDRLFVTVSDGGTISGGIVTALVQDENGLIWIGTQAGLIRYDGYSFVLYRPDVQKPNSIAGDYVRSLAFAGDGKLWIGTIGSGISIYDPATDTFTNHKHDADDPTSLSNDRVDALAGDPRGGMWIGTNGGLDYLPPGSDRFMHHPHDSTADSPNDDRIRSLLVDRRGDLWVGSWNGLNRLRAGANRFEDVAESSPTTASLVGKNILRLYQDQRGSLWFGTPENGGGWPEPETMKIGWLPFTGPATEALSHPWVTGIAENGPGELWVGTYGGGINVVDLNSRRIIGHLRADPSVSSSVGTSEIGPLLVDRSGLLWVGTWGEGLQYFNTRNHAFRMIHPSSIGNGGLSFADVQSLMVAQDGIVWVGTAGNGIDLLDMNSGVIGGIRVEKNTPGSLTDGSISALAQSTDGTVWIGTRQGGLFRRDPDGRHLRQYTSDNGLIDNYIHRLLVERDGKLWIGTSGGLNRFDPRSATFSTIATQSNPDTPFTEQIDALVGDSAGNLWIGAESGLYVLADGADRLQRIAHDPSDPKSLSNNDVNALMIDHTGTLWASTARGLDRLISRDGSGAIFDSVSARIGLPGQAIGTNLMEDRQGRIWPDVQAMINPADWTVRYFGLADGFDIGTSWIRSYAQLPDGRMLYGGSKGIVVVDADQWQPWNFDPPLVISEVSIEGTRMPPETSITLPAETRNFSVGFAALDFSDPSANRYQFRLDPYDRDWNDAAATRRIATYTHLDPGQYTLRIRGSNRLGQWGSKPLSISIHQEAAWFQTRVFRIALAALALFLLYLAYRWRIRQLEAARQALDTMVRERTTELEHAMSQLEQASLTDPLTGLRNRRYLSTHIEPDQQLSIRAHDKESLSGSMDLLFFLFDIDHFKSVNDTYGHSAGDAILVQFAQILRDGFRSSDVLVRWGGEEFLAVSRFVNHEIAAELAERLRRQIEAHAFDIGGGRSVRKTVSIGFAAFPFVPDQPSLVGWEQVIDIADTALLAAKRTQRNAWIGLSAKGATDKGGIEELFRNPNDAIRKSFHVESSIDPGQPICWD
jgi:diguanylate cyclase (GGDEF)-like protein